MEDLHIAYDVLVIFIGLAALSITAFWAIRTRESGLRDFCILYASFTLILVVMVLKKYLFLNVETYSARSWYFISGMEQVLNLGVIVATIHYFLGMSQARSRKRITLALLVLMVISIGLILSPIGAVLDADHQTIHFGIGYRIASGWYFASFTLLLVLGYGLLRRVWHTDKRDFITGLLIFATVGYVETLINLPGALGTTEVSLSNENAFLFSSIPYALYGIFLINYFLHSYHLTPLVLDELSETFRSKYGITEREREIILKVMQGKSNADIAGELFISLATVKTHLHNIYTKMGVDSRYDLLARVRSGQ